MSGAVQAPALVAPEVFKVAGNETCSPTIGTVDALSVGLSMMTLARQRTMPTGTREIYERVGRELIAAARLALAEGK